jgi:hypothetical protein
MGPNGGSVAMDLSKLERRHTGRLRKRDNLLMGEEKEGGGRGAKSYDRKKAWAFTNHSILSGPQVMKII